MSAAKPLSVFETLSKIDVSEFTKEKNQMTYLPWAWAWTKLKSLYPQSYYTIYENAQGYNYHHDGKTAWVKVGVTVVDDAPNEDGMPRSPFVLEHIENLPVLNMRNQSIPLENVDSYSVNKAIQRAMVKAIARHGLGLYIYAGEDLPDDDTPPPPPKKKKPEEVVRSARAQELFSKLDAALKALTTGKNAEERKPIIAKIKEIAKTANYRTISDEATLEKLCKEFCK